MTFAIHILGGIGLFLVGVWMMTDGLKLAAGDLLRRILVSATSSPLRGLFAGFLITTLVRSSAAVTIATIGFVNAGLIGLAPAIWLVYGTNIGTTTTAWLVALAGADFDITALALPLIGIGMLLRLLASANERLMGLGMAVAGFGVFFVGIAFLQQGFDDVTPHLAAFDLDPTGWLVIPAFVGLGIVLTLLTQSSAVAVAIVLTASAGGSVPLLLAAAAVIGTNIGTTSIAAIAAIGATAPARRVAAAHFIFNVLTAVIALLLLPWLVDISERIAILLAGEAATASTLAVFHTVFNCLGVLAIAGVTGRLIEWLSMRFVTQEERIGRPRYLDTTLVGVPALALRALTMEAERMAEVAFDVARTRISEPASGRSRVAGMHVGALRIGSEIRAMIGKLNRQSLSDDDIVVLPDIIRGVQHVEEVLAISAQIEPTPRGRSKHQEEEFLQELRAMVLGSLEMKHGHGEEPQSGEAPGLSLRSVEDTYQKAKRDLLVAVGHGRLEVGTMEKIFFQARQLRRCAEAALKARRRLERWTARLDGEAIADSFA